MPDLIPETMYVVYSLNGGGAERLLTNILLQQRVPQRSMVVSLRPGGIFRRTLEEGGINVEDLGMTRYHHVFRGLFQLASLMRARRPEVVHGWDYFANVLAFFALLIAPVGARLFFAVFCTDLAMKLKWRFRAVIRLNALLSSRVDGERDAIVSKTPSRRTSAWNNAAATCISTSAKKAKAR